MREAMETKMLTLRRRTRAIGCLSGWPFGLLKDPSVASRLVGYRSTWSSKLGLIGPRARKSYYGHVQNHQLRSQETQRGRPLSKRRYRTVSMDPSVHLELSKKVQRTSVVILVPFSDLIPQAPNSTGPVLLTMANVKPGIPSASTIFCTDSTKSGVRIVGDVPLRVDRRSLPAARTKRALGSVLGTREDSTALGNATTTERRKHSSLMTLIDREGVG